MNRYPPPRPLSVLWHACRPLVSTRQKLLRYRSLQSPNAPPQPTIPSSTRTSRRQNVQITANSSTQRTRPNPFKVHRLPCGRLPSSRCVRSDLPKRVRTRTVACGRSRYSTRTCRDQDGHSRVAGCSPLVPKMQGTRGTDLQWRDSLPWTWTTLLATYCGTTSIPSILG